MRHTWHSVLGALRQALGDTQGSSFVLVLVMITVITTIIGAILMGTLLQARFIRASHDQLQALYCAEAGIYKTIWQLSGNAGKDFFWRPQNETIVLLTTPPRQ